MFLMIGCGQINCVLQASMFLQSCVQRQLLRTKPRMAPDICSCSPMDVPITNWSRKLSHRIAPLYCTAVLQVAKSLRFTCSVPKGYEEDVQRAIWTFRHQRVFCPQSRRLVHLTPLPVRHLLSFLHSLLLTTMHAPDGNQHALDSTSCYI